MRRISVGFAVLATLSAMVWAASADGKPADILLYVGTQGSGTGQGIIGARLNEATGTLIATGVAAEIDRPTALAPDPERNMLYSVSEVGSEGVKQGGVFSLAVDRKTGSLRITGRADSGGAGATHLSYDERNHMLFVANYGGGQVSAIPVKADGTLSAASSVQTDLGSGPHSRQKGPHAHAAVVDPTHTFVLAADLGADRIFVYRFDPTGKTLAPATTPFAQLPPGSGPRHLVFSRDGRFVFVITELTSEIYSYRWAAPTGRLTELSHVALDPPGFTGSHSGAEIAISRDGRFLYASNRAANSIQVYAVGRDTGSLVPIQQIDCGGRIPWSFAIAPGGRWLVVANQGSNALSEFAVDPVTGRLAATSTTLMVNRPVAVAFVGR